MTPDRRTLLALFSLAFGLRVLYAVVFGSDPEVIEVRETYDFRVAARIAADPASLATPFSPNAPGYLLLLAAAFKLLGVSWWTAVILNCVLGAVTALFLYRIGERLLGKYVGLASALWLGLSVNHMHFAGLAIREVLVTFLATWLAYALARPFYRMRTSVWTAFLYVLLVHTEPLYLVLLPLLVVFLAIGSTHHRVLSIQYVFLFTIALFVFMTPWTVRNWIVHRDVVPVSLEATHYTAPVGRLLRDAPPFEPTRAGPETASRSADGGPRGFFANQREFWRVLRTHEAPGDPERGVTAQPAWSLRHNATSVLNYGVLLPFFVTGLVAAWARRNRAALVLGSIVLSLAIVRGFVGAITSSRLWVEPLIILIALYGMKVLLDMRRAAGQPTPGESR